MDLVSQRGKLKWAGLASVSVGAATLVMVLWGFSWQQRSKEELARELFASGQMSLQNGRADRAWEQFSQAAELDATLPVYAYNAALAANRIGAQESASRFAQQAWQDGLRDVELLRVFTQNTLLLTPPPLSEEHFLAMCDELPSGAATQRLRAEILDLAGRTDEAIALWHKLLELEPTPELLLQIARGHIQVGESRLARELLEAPEQQHLLNEISFSLLVNLQAAQQDWHRALQTCRQAQKKGQYGGPVQLDHALLLAIRDQPEEACQVLHSLTDPTSSSAGAYPLHARILLSYLRFRLGDRATVENLLTRAGQAGGEIWNEAEEHFHQALLVLSDAPQPVTPQQLRDALQKLGLVRRGLPNQPLVEWVSGCLNAQLKQFSAACDDYRAIVGLWSAAPRVLLSHAQALREDREDEQAFWVLDEFHRHGSASRQSLTLLVDLSGRLGRSDLQDWAGQELAGDFAEDPCIDLFALRSNAATATSPVFRPTREPYRNSIELQLARIRRLLHSERYEDALCVGQSSGIPKAQLLPLIALSLQRLGRVEQAEAAYQVAIKTPQDASVHAAYGDLLFEQQRDLHAAQQYEKALSLDPGHFEALVGLATVSERLGDAVACRNYALAALAIDDRREPPYLLLAAADLQLSRFQEGLWACEQALHRCPDSIVAVTLQCLIHQERGALEQAEALIIRLLQEHPGDLELVRLMALLKQNQGEPDETLQWLDKGLSLDADDPELIAQRVTTLTQMGRTDEAQAALQEAKDRLSPELLVGLSAELSAARSEFARAKQILRANLQLPGIAAQLLGLYLQQGQSTEVRQLLDERDWPIDELIGCAQSAAELTDYALAADCYALALRTDPDNPTLLNEWSWHVLQDGEVPDAAVVEAGRQAHEAEPTQPDFLHTYAQSLWQSEQFEACRDLLSNSELTCREPNLSMLLGDCLLELNETADALRAYERCRELFRRDPTTPPDETTSLLDERIRQLKARSR